MNAPVAAPGLNKQWVERRAKAVSRGDVIQIETLTNDAGKSEAIVAQDRERQVVQDPVRDDVEATNAVELGFRQQRCDHPKHGHFFTCFDLNLNE